MSDELRVNSSVTIPRHELEVSFRASGGPGGQHANKTATRAEVRLDLVNTSALTDTQRARAISRLGAELRVVADDERSQLRNRGLAEQRLADRLAAALVVPKPRRPTRRTAGSQRRRLDSKRHRSELKRQRRRPRSDD